MVLPSPVGESVAANFLSVDPVAFTSGRVFAFTPSPPAKQPYAGNEYFKLGRLVYAIERQRNEKVVFQRYKVTKHLYDTLSAIVNPL